MPPCRAAHAVLSQLRGGARRSSALDSSRSTSLMAANIPLYCGRCGAPLTPGAPFCGTCGMPVAVQAQPAYATPQAYSAPVAYAPYSYQRAAPAGRSGVVPQVAVAVALVGIILVVTVGVTAFALRQNAGSHPNCT